MSKKRQIRPKNSNHESLTNLSLSTFSKAASLGANSVPSLASSKASEKRPPLSRRSRENWLRRLFGSRPSSCSKFIEIWFFPYFIEILPISLVKFEYTCHIQMLLISLTRDHLEPAQTVEISLGHLQTALSTNKCTS